MATNNAINLKDSGIVSYDGAGTFSSVGNPLTVANGGTGDSSLTAYAVLCGGTTSTNPVQSIASAGVSGQMLTSNGASALPTFQAKNGSYQLTISTGINSSVTDGATYFISETEPLNTRTSSGTTIQKLIVPYTGSMVAAYGLVTNTGTSSADNVSIIIRINNTTDVTVTSSLQLTATSNPIVNTALNTAVTAGDFLEVKFVSPTWGTNPTSVSMSLSILLI